MKLYIIVRKETRISLWSSLEEIDSIETSFDYDKLETQAKANLTDLGEEYQIDLKKLTATYESKTATTTIQFIIKSVDL